MCSTPKPPAHACIILVSSLYTTPPFTKSISCESCPTKHSYNVEQGKLIFHCEFAVPCHFLQHVVFAVPCLPQMGFAYYPPLVSRVSNRFRFWLRSYMLCCLSATIFRTVTLAVWGAEAWFQPIIVDNQSSLPSL